MKNNSLTIIFGTILLSAATLFAGGNVERLVTPNGITVLHKKVLTIPIVTINIFIRSGSSAEKKDQAGMASFVQNMLFQGTKSRSSEKLAADIEDIGGCISSETQDDYSYIGISVRNENFLKAAEILSEIFMHPSFLNEEIEKEKTNTLAALKARKDTISTVADDVFNETFYGSHPYSRTVLGTEKTVARFKRKDLEKWYKDSYTAKNCVIVIVGDASAESALEAINIYFSDMPKGSVLKTPPAPKLPKNKSISYPTNKFKQAYLIIGFPAPAIGEEGYLELKMLNIILGTRMSSRLFTELREKSGLAYEVSSAYPTRKQLGCFFIYMGLDRSNIAEAESKINNILSKAAEIPGDAKELAESKNFIKGTYLIDHQSIMKQAWYIGWWEVMGLGYEYDDKYIDNLLSTNSENIMKTARKIFSGKKVKVEIVPE